MTQKEKRLLDQLSGYRRLAVAFSGGVDSTLLAAAAKRALGQNHLAVTVVSPLLSECDLDRIRALAARLGFNHLVVPGRMLQDRNFMANRPDRCYVCKGIMVRALQAAARKHGMVAIAEGSHRDDLEDYRPGLRALRQAGVESPFLELGLTKDDIRKIAHHWGLPNWGQPSNSCLATRVPYGVKIDKDVLRLIARAEARLHRLGFSLCRLRHHGEVARIEVALDFLSLALRRRRAIVSALKDLGYRFVALALSGYQKSRQT